MGGQRRGHSVRGVGCDATAPRRRGPPRLFTPHLSTPPPLPPAPSQQRGAQPIVALLIPILLSWSRRCGVPAKKLLIPLSFATVLGGTVTLIGTSTNLVVSGLQQELSKKDPSIPVFSFFDITPYGLPYAM